MSKTRLYSAHSAMLQRCHNEKGPNYKNYGGRGISVDSDLLSFKDFYHWFVERFGMPDMPKGRTLDRIDNDGNYSKENLRLATPRTQCNNRRNTVKVLLRGELLPLSEVCRMFSADLDRTYSRVVTYKKTLKEALLIEGVPEDQLEGV